MKSTIGSVLEYFAADENSPRGEYVLVIEGKSEEAIKEEKRAKWEGISVKDHLLRYINSGMSKKDAIKQVAKDRDVSKRDIYAEATELDI